MALPVSAVAPSPAPRLIDPGSFRSKFDLSVPGLNKDMGDLVCGTIVNTLALKATTNKLRTFTYNLMAKGAYCSEEFVELCNYAASYSVLRYLKDKETRANEEPNQNNELRNLRSAIIASVPEALTLWMSKLIYQYDGLEYELGSEFFHKTKANNAIYHNSLKEIQNMQLNANQIAALLAAAGQNNNNNNAAGLLGALGQGEQMVNLNVNGTVLTLPMSQALQVKAMLEQQQNQSNPLAALLGAAQGGNNALAALLQSGAGGGVSANALGGITSASTNSTQAGTSFAPINLGGTNNNGSSLLNKWKSETGRASDIPDAVEVGNPISAANMAPSFFGGDGAITDVTPKNKPEAKKEEIPVKVSASSVSGSEMLSIPGGNQYGYENEGISLAGCIYRPQDTIFHQELESAVSVLTRQVPSDTVETKADDDGVLKETEVAVNVPKGIGIVTSIQGFIDHVVSQYNKQVALQPEFDEECLAMYGYIAKTHYLPEGDKALYNTVMSKNASIHKVAASIRSVVAGLSKLAANPDRTMQLREIDKTARIIGSMNRWFTDRMNSFIKHNLDNESTNIDSFATDFNDLEIYIAKTYGDAGRVAFDAYLDDVLCSFREASMSTMTEYTKGEEEEAKLSIVTEVTAVGAVMLPYTAEELGINLKDKMVLIDGKNYRALSGACRTIALHAENQEMAILDSYLIFRDGMTVQVFTQPLKDKNTFGIKRVNV